MKRTRKLNLKKINIAKINSSIQIQLQGGVRNTSKCAPPISQVAACQSAMGSLDGDINCNTSC